jgi:hypothetical protein
VVFKAVWVGNYLTGRLFYFVTLWDLLQLLPEGYVEVLAGKLSNSQNGMLANGCLIQNQYLATI